MKRPSSKLEKVVAQKLKSLRGNESQIKFAKRLGIAQSTLNRLENLEASPTIYLLEKIAVKLKIPVESLLKD